MTNTTEFNARVCTKIDSNDNYVVNDPTLLSGEVALVKVMSGNQSVVLAKVGDGLRKFSELNFVSGLSADVYDWAKAELPDSVMSATSTNPIQNKVVKQYVDDNKSYWSEF